MDDDIRRNSGVLTFAPAAWLKLLYFARRADTEVGGFGISASDDPLYIADFATVRQRATWASVEFNDDAVADHFDRMADAGLTPDRFARVWIHTHPVGGAEPSAIDEATFARVFGRCDWAVMFIVSRSGRTYARLSFSAGPGGAMLLPVRVDWSAWPAQADDRSWERRTATWSDAFDADIGRFESHVIDPFVEFESSQDWAEGVLSGDAREVMA